MSQKIHLYIFIPDMIISSHHLAGLVPDKATLVEQILNRLVEVPQCLVPILEHIFLVLKLEL